MKRSPGFLFALCLLGAPGAHAQLREVLTIESPGGMPERVYPHWTVFLHPRFGYELPVPPGVSAVGVPEEATETKFVSPDGGFVVSAWGGMSPQSAAALIEAQWALAKNKPGRTISYQRKSRTWFVISGTDRAGIEFYEKFTARGDHVAAFTINYPRSRLREFEPWVEGIEDGFRAIALANGPAEIAPRLIPGTARTTTESWEISKFSPEVIPSPPRLGAVSGADRPYSRAGAGEKVDLTPPRERAVADFPPTKLEPVKTEVSDTEKTPSEKQPGGETTSDTVDLPIGQKVVGKPGFVYSPFLSEKRLVDVVDIAPGTKVKCPYTEKVFRVP